MGHKVAWIPSEGEIEVFYDSVQRDRYKARKPSEYDRWKWPVSRRVGRNRGSCFPEVVARAYFERLGYEVLLSDPRYPKGLGFILFHYRQRRKAGDKAFQRMQDHFPAIDLDALAELAYHAKKDACGTGGGGDPDLFVFHPDSGNRFFVEVKDQDQLHRNQLVCFPIIEKSLCPVKIVRIQPMHTLSV